MTRRQLVARAGFVAFGFIIAAALAALVAVCVRADDLHARAAECSARGGYLYSDGCYKVIRVPL